MQTLNDKFSIVFNAGEGGSVSHNGGIYENGETITVTAIPMTEYEFLNWSDGITDPTRSITINSSFTISANFVKKKYPLILLKEGEGQVLEEIINSSRTTEYNSGATIKITAIPAEGWRFFKWEGIESNSLIETINITSNITIKAIFKKNYPFPNALDTPYDDSFFDEFLVGLDITESERNSLITNANRFIEICIGQNFFKEDESGQIIGLKNPLIEIYNSNTWPIYFHFEEYEGEISSVIIERIKNDYQSHLNSWLDGIRSYDNEFPDLPTEVKIFGFVFNNEVKLSESFYEVYGNYPRVLNYNLTNEESPWKIVKKDNYEIFNYNWYIIENFDDLKVVGNRTDLSPSIEFYPDNWDNYSHPEAIDHFQTKFWYKIPWDAVAQRQYLKMGGNILNHSTGETNLVTFLHEMGHCFFLDDVYNRGKYPNAEDLQSIMNTSDTISNFDIMTLRIVWKHQKNY